MKSPVPIAPPMAIMLICRGFSVLLVAVLLTREVLYGEHLVADAFAGVLEIVDRVVVGQLVLRRHRLPLHRSRYSAQSGACP